MDAAGPGRKASRTSRPARKTAFVARYGRSAPSAAARDPAVPRPPSEKVNTVTASSQPAALGQYLARHGFAPNPGSPAWLDRDTRQQIIRVLHEPGETTWLYCLDPRRGCLYEARFSPGTPDAVIIAAIEAALKLSSPRAAKPDHGPASRVRKEAVTGDDDR